MAFIERYSINENGAITFTGNTLGLSRSGTPGVPGTVDSIGAYITTDTTQQFGTYPPGTTSVFLNNSSAAVLQIPAGSTVLYAELIWGGTYIDGTENNSAFINNPVLFTTPLGQTSVLPDTATRFEVILSTQAGFPTTYAYVRSAEVTNLVSAAGAGAYTTGGVVGTLSIPDPTSNHAGWTLGVVYQNPALPLRNMSIRVTADVILSTSGPVNMVIDGFATPFMGPLAGRALFSSQEGDAIKTGDQARFDPTIGTVTNLSGPNNFATNFFASQINNDAGLLDTSGTFGTRNQINGTPGTNIIGGRQGWDITNVDVGFTLHNTQTQATFQLTTNGDGYLVDGNGLQIDINTPVLTAVKSANVADAIVGDTVTYSIVISNTSLVDATNVMFFDNIPDSTTFVMNSITIDGVPQAALDPITGAPIGILVSGASVTVSFQVVVTSLPAPPRLFNQAKVGYTAPTVPGGPVINTAVPTNAIEIPVFQPNVAIVKSAETSNVQVGENVTYTLVVTNTGNISATTTVLDNIPDGSVFVPGSVTINSVVQPGADPVTGIPIGPVAPNTVFTVTFQVNVVSQPAGFQLVNQGTASYTYQPPDGRVIPGSVVSNTVIIPVTLPFVSVVKSTPVLDAVVGDTVTYSIVVTNQDTIPVTDILLTDAIPPGSVFAVGSVTVDGVSQPTSDPMTGIAVGTLLGGASSTITFSVNVTSLPEPAELTDQAQVTFTSGTFSGASFSDVVTIPVFQAIIGITKTAVPTFAVVGQIISFQFIVNNTGNIDATTFLTDIIPAETAFVPGTVLVDNISIPAADPNSGFSLGIVPAGGSVLVSFQIVINSLPESFQIINQATTSFTYTPPDGRVIPGAADSNVVVIPISADNVTVIKSANELQAIVGDIVTYTLVVQNNDAIDLTSVILTDPVAPASVFVTDSVTIDGVSIPGADPDTGIAIGTITANGTVTITFQVTVVGTAPPVPFPLFLTDQATLVFSTGDFTGVALSNIVNVRVFEPIINLVKSADTLAAIVGDIIAYTVVVSNLGNYNADVVLLDPLPAGETFVTNSVLINGNRWSSADPITGINLGTVQPQFPVTVTFLATVTSLLDPPELVNQATGNFTYILPDGRVIPGTSQSNIVTIPVSDPGTITVTKLSNQTIVTSGNIVTYTFSVLNGSSAIATNVILTDPIPDGSTFVPDSLTLNGVVQIDADPSDGFLIGSLAGNSSNPLTFQVSVDNLSVQPVPNTLINQANLTFILNGLGGSTSSNLVEIPILAPVITILKSASPAEVDLGDTVQYVLSVQNSGNTSANVTLVDPIPLEAVFIPDSLTVNGVPIISDPVDGIPIGTLPPGDITTVAFAVNILNFPANNQVVNEAIATYTYTLPDGSVTNNSVNSNSVVTIISDPLVDIIKTASPTQVAPNQIIDFSFTLVNGNNLSLSDVLFFDQIPQGTTFVSGSVTSRGVNIPGANPATGVGIENVEAGATISIRFQVTVNSGITLTQITNQASVEYRLGSIPFRVDSNIVIIPVTAITPTVPIIPSGPVPSTPPVASEAGSGVSQTSSAPAIPVQKTANKTVVEVGETINYAILIQNTSPYTATQLVLKDKVQSEAHIVSGSIHAPNLPQTGTNLEQGLILNQLLPGESIQIHYQVLVKGQPANSKLVNQASLSIVYVIPGAGTATITLASNTTVVTIVESEE
ncbi:beta strand repeat-containing protein [Paenibacillus taichungensis]|uniref:beta strand repeat-containing protein n=1 Tax=Paenibacillus taichungensis TaxID=484184 RepID=UPI0039A6AFEA